MKRNEFRKIDAMHKRYGIQPEHKCSECMHLITREYGRRYYKCELYGLSCSEATDWRIKYIACGMFNAEREANFGRADVWKEPSVVEPMEGQISLEEEKDV